MVSMSVDVPEVLAVQLGTLAHAMGSTENALAIQAMQDFVEREIWQITAITQALREADAGDFATDAELAALDAKWGANAC